MPKAKDFPPKECRCFDLLEVNSEVVHLELRANGHVGIGIRSVCPSCDPSGLKSFESNQTIVTLTDTLAEEIDRLRQLDATALARSELQMSTPHTFLRILPPDGGNPVPEFVAEMQVITAIDLTRTETIVDPMLLEWLQLPTESDGCIKAKLQFRSGRYLDVSLKSGPSEKMVFGCYIGLNDVLTVLEQQSANLYGLFE